MIGVLAVLGLEGFPQLVFLFLVVLQHVLGLVHGSRIVYGQEPLQDFYFFLHGRVGAHDTPRTLKVTFFMQPSTHTNIRVQTSYDQKVVVGVGR